MKPLNLLAALSAVAIIFAVVAMSLMDEKAETPRTVKGPPVQLAPDAPLLPVADVEPPDDAPIMLTVEQPADWQWSPDDSELLDDDGHHAEMLYSEPRSSCWRKTRADYLEAHPQCEFKGCNETHELQVHHVQPFHLYPEKECDPKNLICACVPHHCFVAHQGSFREFNRRVRADFAAGRYPLIGWERLLANREKHKKQRAKEDREAFDNWFHWRMQRKHGLALLAF